MDSGRPVAEVLVEGELSPFEHDPLYKLLKRHFQIDQPVYSELPDETIGTLEWEAHVLILEIEWIDVLPAREKG